jgi:hypothetical protein
MFYSEKTVFKYCIFAKTRTTTIIINKFKNLTRLGVRNPEPSTTLCEVYLELVVDQVTDRQVSPLKH